MLNVFLALLATIVVTIAISMFLDDNIMLYFIKQPIVPILNTNDATNESSSIFFMDTQISDDMPYNY